MSETVFPWFTRGSSESPGMLRLRRMQRDFDRAVGVWQPYQCEIFEQMLRANIEHFLGADYVDCMTFLQFRQKRVYQSSKQDN